MEMDAGPTEQQVRFFDTFGFIRFPGLFAADIGRITEAFEQVWADHGGGHHGQAHDHRRRNRTAPGFLWAMLTHTSSRIPFSLIQLSASARVSCTL